MWARAKHFGCHSVSQCSMIIHVVSMFPIATLCYWYRRRDHALQVSPSWKSLYPSINEVKGDPYKFFFVQSVHEMYLVITKVKEMWRGMSVRHCIKVMPRV